MTNKNERPALTCGYPGCEATAKDTSKDRGRFLRRHPKLCQERGTQVTVPEVPEVSEVVEALKEVTKENV